MWGGGGNDFKIKYTPWGWDQTLLDTNISEFNLVSEQSSKNIYLPHVANFSGKISLRIEKICRIGIIFLKNGNVFHANCQIMTLILAFFLVLNHPISRHVRSEQNCVYHPFSVSHPFPVFKSNLFLTNLEDTKN